MGDSDDTLRTLIAKYPDLQGCAPQIGEAYVLLAEAFRNGGKLLLCGNGGSAADCDHIVGELMKGFARRRPVSDAVRVKLRTAWPQQGDWLADRLQGALPAIALPSHAALLSATANDVSADMVYAQQVFAYGRAGDILLGISTSGNAVNVLQALRVGLALGLKTIGLTGRTGGAMRDSCDVAICVPYDRTHEIQERHLPIYHCLCLMLEGTFFDS